MLLIADAYWADAGLSLIHIFLLLGCYAPIVVSAFLNNEFARYFDNVNAELSANCPHRSPRASATSLEEESAAYSACLAADEEPARDGRQADVLLLAEVSATNLQVDVDGPTFPRFGASKSITGLRAFLPFSIMWNVCSLGLNAYYLYAELKLGVVTMSTSSLAVALTSSVFPLLIHIAVLFALG